LPYLAATRTMQAKSRVTSATGAGDFTPSDEAILAWLSTSTDHDLRIVPDDSTIFDGDETADGGDPCNSLDVVFEAIGAA
jgi:hypothetical protein